MPQAAFHLVGTMARRSEQLALVGLGCAAADDGHMDRGGHGAGRLADRNCVTHDTFQRLFLALGITAFTNALEFDFERVHIGDGVAGDLAQGLLQCTLRQARFVGGEQLAGSGAVQRHRVAEPDVQRYSLRAHAAVGVEHPLPHAQGQVHVVTDGFCQVLQVAPRQRADVERRGDRQCDAHRARTDGIQQVLTHAEHFGSNHGLQHVVHAAHRQLQRVLDLGQAQAGLVLDQQAQHIERSQVTARADGGPRCLAMGGWAGPTVAGFRMSRPPA